MGKPGFPTCGEPVEPHPCLWGGFGRAAPFQETTRQRGGLRPPKNKYFHSGVGRRSRMDG